MEARKCFTHYCHGVSVDPLSSFSFSWIPARDARIVDLVCFPREAAIERLWIGGNVPPGFGGILCVDASDSISFGLKHYPESFDVRCGQSVVLTLANRSEKDPIVVSAIFALQHGEEVIGGLGSLPDFGLPRERPSRRRRRRRAAMCPRCWAGRCCEVDE